MLDWWISTGLGVAAVVTGWLVYRLSARNHAQALAEKKANAAGALFDDALELKDNFKEAYDELRCEVVKLREEVEALRTELHEQHLWKGVAASGARAWFEWTGESPLWWPPDEAKPWDTGVSSEAAE